MMAGLDRRARRILLASPHRKRIKRELKKRWGSKFDQARQRLLLTPTEKRVVVFVLAAFVLGLGTKCYRDAHPSPSSLAPKPTRETTPP
jgi:hypothetical protein